MEPTHIISVSMTVEQASALQSAAISRVRLERATGHADRARVLEDARKAIDGAMRAAKRGKD